jgi:hypothetical protein
MDFEISSTTEFSEWFRNLEESIQAKVIVKVKLLGNLGPNLRRPHAGDVRGSKYSNMRELVVQVGGRPYRVFYLFGSTRKALLLIGGVKDGAADKNFYKTMVQQADQLVEKYKWK